MKKRSDICIIGTEEKRMVRRNEVILHGLNELGISIEKIQSPSFGSRTILQKREKESIFEYHSKFWIGLMTKIILENINLFFTALSNISKIRDTKILYIQGYGNYIIPTVFFYSKIFNKHIFFDAHGSLYYQRIVGCGDYPVDSLYAKYIFYIDKISAILVDKYITLSRSYAEKLSSVFKIPTEKFLSIYSGSITNKEMANNIVQKTDIEYDIAQFSSFKDFHGVLDIIYLVDYLVKSKKRADIKVLLSGKGPLLIDCKKLTEKLGLRENVYFNDYKIGDKELFKMIFKSKIIFGPMGDSYLNEIDFSTKICEALAFGKVLVTLDSPSARELLEDGKSAVLINIKDKETSSEKILSILHDQEKRKSIEEQAFNIYLKNLTPKSIASKLVNEMGIPTKSSLL